MPDALAGPPPMPRMGQNPNGPTPPPPQPSFQGLSGQPPPGADPTAGSQQIGGAAVRMALEVDQALKLIAQTIPQMAPWVEKTVMELREQIGQALQSGVPTSPTPSGAMMPGGGQNL